MGINIKSLSENNRIIICNIIGAFAVKGMALIVSFLSMPIYIRFFDNEVALGLWFTILSVLTWILNFDLGVGNGLRNHLTKALTENNKKEAKELISSAYFSVGMISILFILCFLIVSPLINWNIVFNIGNDIVSKQSLLTSVQVVFIGIAIQLALRLVTSILYAMQHSFVNNVLALLTSLLMLIAVLVMPSKGNDINIVTMSFVHIIAANLPLIFATIVVFSSKKMRGVVPNKRDIHVEPLKRVLSLGGIFFFIQIMYMLIMNTNEYLITLFSSSEDVVQYQIYYKVFFLGSTIFTLALTPIWSVVTKAITEGNLFWLKQLYSKMFKFAFIGTLCEFVIVLFAQQIINLWLQSEAIDINYFYCIAFACMGSLMLYNSVMSSMANGMGTLKTQAVFFSIGAILKIPMAYYFILLVDSWIGVVISNVLIIGLYCIVQGFAINKELKTRTDIK